MITRPIRVMVLMVLSNTEHPARCMGGVDSVCQMQLEKLKQDVSGREYLVVAFNPANDTTTPGKEFSLSPNVKVVSYDVKNADGLWKLIPNVIWQNFRIEKHAHAFRPHIIHTHIPSWKILPTHRAKKITTLHAMPGMSNLGALNSYVFEIILPEWSVRTSAVATTVSIEEQERLSKKGYRNIEFVPNGIGDVFFDITDPKQQETNEINICMTGVLAERKRVLVGIESIGEKAIRSKNIVLNLISSANSKAYIEKIEAASLHLGGLNKIKLLEHKSAGEIVEIYQSSCCGLFLSAEEGFGLAPLEMLAAGLPLISTAVGVMKWERKKFEELGVRYVEIDDVEGTVMAINEMIRNPPTEDTRQRARQFVSESFSSKNACDKYVSLYERLT